MSGSKETMCTRCSHLQVCKYKEQFLTAQQTVDDLEVHSKSNQEKVSIIRLLDISWIEPVNLRCVYFTEKRSLTKNYHVACNHR